MERLWRERSPPLPAYETLVRPGQAPPAQAPFASAAVASPREPERKVKRIKLTGSLASSTAGSAATTAPSPNPQLASTTTAQPAPAPSLTVKLGGGRLTPSLASTSQYADSSAVASISRSPSAAAPGPQSARQDSEDATVRTGGAAAEGATGEETKPPSIPTIPDVESGWLSGPAVRSSRDPQTRDSYTNLSSSIPRRTKQCCWALWIVCEPTPMSGASGKRCRLLEPVLTALLAQRTTARDAPDRCTGASIATGLLRVGQPSHLAQHDRCTRFCSASQMAGTHELPPTKQANIRAHAYASAEACDRDLHRLFEVARLFIRPDSPGNVYSDLMVLQVHDLSVPPLSRPGCN